MKLTPDDRHTMPRHYYFDDDPDYKGRLTQWHAKGQQSALTEYHTPECEDRYGREVEAALNAGCGLVRSCTCDPPSAPPAITFGA